MHLIGKLREIVNKKLQDAHRVTMKDVNMRKLPIKLRDGISRLFSPYL
jgi:hypothetical protein